MNPDSLGDAPAEKKPKLTAVQASAARLAAFKLKEAARLDEKVRRLRADAILLEAQAEKLRAEVKP